MAEPWREELRLMTGYEEKELETIKEILRSNLLTLSIGEVQERFVTI